MVDGHKYTVSLTIGGVRSLVDKTSFDLLTIGEQEAGMVRLLVDPLLLVEVLWILCGEQHNDACSREKFENACGGDELHEGWSALVEALVFFTRRMKGDAMADAMMKVIEKEAETLDVAATSMSAAMVAQEEKIDTAFKDKMDREMAKGIGTMLEELEATEETETEGTESKKETKK